MAVLKNFYCCRIKAAWCSIILNLGLLAAAGLYSNAVAQPPANVAADPAAAKFVYEDLHNFTRTLELFRAGGDSREILQREYFDRGTPGLRAYVERHGITAELMLEAIKSQPDEYRSVEDLPKRLAEQEAEIRQAFRKLQQLDPDTVFPPTYFLVGPWGVSGEGWA